MAADTLFQDTIEARIRSYAAQEGLRRLSHTTNRHVDRFLIALKHVEVIAGEFDLPAESTLPEIVAAAHGRDFEYKDLPAMTRNFLDVFVGEPAIFRSINVARSVHQLGEIMQANVAALLSHVPLYFVALQHYCRTIDPDMLPIREYTTDLENILGDLPRLARFLSKLRVPVDLSKPVYEWAPVPDRTWNEYPHWGTTDRNPEVDKSRFQPYFRDASATLVSVLGTPMPALSHQPLVDLLVQRQYLNTIEASAVINPALADTLRRFG